MSVTGSQGVRRIGDEVKRTPDRAERAVESNRRTIEVFTRVGWLAKGVVYTLFGLTAVAIATRSSTDDEASPQGALGAVMDVPGGRLLIGVLAVGLFLYALWRAASVVMERGSDLTDWLDRIGYTFSAVFYVILGFTAARSAIQNREPGESNTVERLSRTLLESSWGRWLLGLVGVVTIAVGLVFVVKKGIMRSFTEDLRGVSEDASANDGIDHAIYVGGVVGWIGRGIVTALVGFFILRSAINFDPDEARGFDKALREAVTSSVGSLLVWISAIGLIAYGVFCLLSHRRRTLVDQS